MFNSYAAWYRIYTLKITLLSVRVPKTSSSQSLPQTAVCEPKPPAWSLAPMQIKKSWAAPFTSSQTPQTYHGGLRKYPKGHLSTKLCASVEKQPMSPKKGKKAPQQLLPNAINLLSTKIYTMAWQQINVSVYDEA